MMPATESHIPCSNFSRSEDVALERTTLQDFFLRNRFGFRRLPMGASTFHSTRDDLKRWWLTAKPIEHVLARTVVSTATLSMVVAVIIAVSSFLLG